MWVEAEKYARKRLYPRRESTDCSLAFSRLSCNRCSNFVLVYIGRRSPTVRSTIRQWRDGYKTRVSHNHRGGNRRPRIDATLWNEIRNLFFDDPRIPPRTVAAQTSESHSTVWNFIRRELRLYPYKLQMAIALTEYHERSRLRFARKCQRQLRNVSVYLERIMFYGECNLSLCGKVNKQSCCI